MPNAKRNRRVRRPLRRTAPGVSSCPLWFMREVAPLFRRLRLPRSRSRRHLRNATIEVLEAVRVLLDETIEWLRHEGRLSAELKRIRVEG